ncbi:MAG: aldo/keto reductase [Sphingomonadaceae bacterium]|nr:aldo/keto reductase [Sphingomonadaceae bacterium]
MTDRVELALGTAQFGLAYGVAGRGAMVDERQVGEILEQASKLGIRRLDTAAAYGSIEERLARLARGGDFEVVSKVPAIPEALDAAAVRAFVLSALDRSAERLGDLLRGMLFHRAADLAGPHGAAAWEAALGWGRRHGVVIGASGYGPAELTALLGAYPIAMVQLPGNAIDQRLVAAARGFDGVEISLRSLFLQGLLLMPEATAARRLPAAAPLLARWHGWCDAQRLSPLAASLAVAKGLPGVRYCIVGVDDAAQLAEIAAAWADASPRTAAEIGTDDPAVIDPRQWELAA